MSPHAGILSVTAASLMAALALADEAEQLSHFEKKIRPVLVAQCYGCHAADAKEIKGGLVLDTRDGIRQGGDSGPAVVPGNPKASLLLAAIRHQDGLEMPPKGKLSEEQIADFVKWIEAGASDPREGGVAKKAAQLNLDEPQFWAFRRPEKQAPPAADEAWPISDVDRFVLAAQQRAGLQAVGDADPRTLARRLYFDLVGLPPTPEEVAAFVDGWSRDPQSTLAATVDRLLESPRYGERWGRHWLDVARYAESSGKETNFSYPQAWRYRDYVIDSFNADVPFNQFVREQIAGDLLPSRDEIQQAEQLVATGFLALGPKSHIERNRRQFEMDLVDEQIDAVTQAFLGLTVACARCHDHKFDPVPQTDYYALAGIFRSTETLYGTIRIIQNANPSQLLPLPANAAMSAGIVPLSSEERGRLEQQVAELRAKRDELTRSRQFASPEFVQNNIRLSTLEAKLDAYDPDGRPKVRAMGVRDRARPRDSELFVRGEVDKPGAVVPRGLPAFASSSRPTDISAVAPAADRERARPGFFRRLGAGRPGTESQATRPGTESQATRLGTESRATGGGSGRLELADWIASADNPFTARVLVNRVWLHLFGRGLVTTPDNFGASGQPPSHPDLLDYLAVTFVEDGWSVKKLIRRLTLSRVYRLDSSFVAANFETDPDNVYLWRMSPKRLDAEAIRDAMLATAGKLDLKPPVGSAVASTGEGYTAGLERFGQLVDQRFNCRSVYLPAIRGRVMESLAEFDGTDGNLVTGQRSETTVPSQSLYLLNSPYVMGLAGAAAQRLIDEASSPEQRVKVAYARWFGRSPTEAERDAALSFVNRYRDQVRGENRFVGGSSELAAWTAFCQSLWASGEFLVRK